MGVTEDINWLKENEGGVKVFLLIAGRLKDGLSLRELKESYGSEDWWPVKAHLRALADRGLVEASEGSYRLTEYGRKKVLEGLRAMEYVKPV
ncbi:MAG: hypothetical protein QMD00_05725 [Hadesarchaea archaeon]|nr:hypothetical protein [Hadesarchaea archaeon]